MALAKSKLTAQGQISVPAEVRQRLGIGPGSVLEWDEQDDQVVVRRAGRYTSRFRGNVVREAPLRRLASAISATTVGLLSNEAVSNGFLGPLINQSCP